MRTYRIAQGTLLNAYGDLNGKEIPQRGDIYMCIYIYMYTVTDSHCCTTENKTTL